MSTNGIEITSDAEFRELVSSHPGPVVVCCVATWTCKKFISGFKKWAEEAPKNVRCIILDTSNAELLSVSTQCGVRKTPGFLIFHKTQLVGITDTIMRMESETRKLLS